MLAAMMGRTPGSAFANQVNFRVTPSWTVPAGVTSVNVRAFGLGATTDGNPLVQALGGGGGGGAILNCTLAVAPGQVYTSTTGGRSLFVVRSGGGFSMEVESGARNTGGMGGAGGRAVWNGTTVSGGAGGVPGSPGDPGTSTAIAGGVLYAGGGGGGSGVGMFPTSPGSAGGDGTATFPGLPAVGPHGGGGGGARPGSTPTAYQDPGDPAFGVFFEW